MGIDWETILGAEDADLADAYEDSIYESGYDYEDSRRAQNAAAPKTDRRISVNPNNMLQFKGRIASVKEFSAGKAANVVLAVDNVKDRYGSERTHLLQLISFSPACYNTLKVGSTVRICGHAARSRYEKDGKPVYSQQLVVDSVEVLFLPRRKASRRSGSQYSARRYYGS